MSAYLDERRRPRWKCEVVSAVMPEGRPTGVTPAEDRIVLMSAFCQLKADQRAVVALRFWEYLTVEQTAAALGTSPNAVINLTRRALKALRIAIGGQSFRE